MDQMDEMELMDQMCYIVVAPSSFNWLRLFLETFHKAFENIIFSQLVTIFIALFFLVFE